MYSYQCLTRLFFFQFDMVFRSIDSGAWGIMITPVLKEIYIAEVNSISYFQSDCLCVYIYFIHNVTSLHRTL